MLKKILLGILFLLISFAVYIKYALSKFDYDFNIVKYTATKIDIKNGEAIINVVVDVFLKSSLFFSLPVNLLYYEIYYNENLLGKSVGASSFNIEPEPTVSKISQSIDLIVDKKNIQVALNYLSKTPTDFTAKIIVDVAGFKFTLKNLKFSY